jgi:hypothetical protein
MVKIAIEKRPFDWLQPTESGTDNRCASVTKQNKNMRYEGRQGWAFLEIVTTEKKLSSAMF